jgi:nicotinate-nucleotide adenylyltransferase
MKTLIFGGSFNPPHWGHVFPVCQAIASREYDKIIVVPSYCHPYGKKMIDYKHRMIMTQIAFDWIDVLVSNVERHLTEKHQGQIYMYDVVKYFAASHHAGEYDSIWLLGGNDTEADMENWHLIDKLKKLISGVHVVSRTDGVIPNLNSTEVRYKLGGRDQERMAGLEVMVPERVLEYIYAYDLYSDPIPQCSHRLGDPNLVA